MTDLADAYLILQHGFLFGCCSKYVEAKLCPVLVACCVTQRGMHTSTVCVCSAALTVGLFRLE
jgi:hypothetical protein